MLPSVRLARLESFCLALSALCLCLPIDSRGAKTLSINWSSDWTEFNDSSGNALSQGVVTANQDGAAVQLGYFSQATAENLFAGDWTPLTWATSIGDTKDLTGYGDGTFSFTVHFKEDSQFVQVYDDADTGKYNTEASHAVTTSMPAEGAYLAIRFFNAPLGSATHYNTIASTAWQWTELSDLSFQTLSLFVDEVAATAQFEDAASTYATSIALDSWDYGKSTQGSWSYLPWLGHYYQAPSSPWIYHADHGWLYRSGTRPGDVWFYDKSGLGWIWTSADAYPYFYSNAEAGWLWFNQDSAQREIYHYGSSQWQTHNLSQ